MSNDHLLAARRTACTKCGNQLPRKQDTTTALGAYCPRCRYLLKIGDPSNSTDLRETLEEIGAWPPYDERQEREPIPFIPLPVQDWPEILERRTLYDFLLLGER